MKKIIFLFAAVLIASVTTLSAKDRTSVNPVTFQKADEINLKMDLGNISKMSDQEIKAKVEDFISKNVSKNNELTCSVEITGSIDVGFAEFEIKITVSGPCSEIRKAGKQLAADILNQVKAELEKVFE